MIRLVIRVFPGVKIKNSKITGKTVNTILLNIDSGNPKEEMGIIFRNPIF